MKKRFAMALAAVLVAVLLAGSAALSLGVLGARPASGTGDAEPRVRTIQRTVTVHKQAPSDASFVNAISAPATSQAGGGDGWDDDEGAEDGDRFEDDGSDQEDPEDGEHDDADHDGGGDDAFETDDD